MWLYDALSSVWSCDDRVEHLAAMSLTFEDRCQHSSSGVRFNLAVTCNQSMIHPALPPAPSCLSIESAPIMPVVGDESLPTSTTSLQSALYKMGAVTQKVKFDIPAFSTKSTTATLIRAPETALGPHLNLCTIGRLCRYFQQPQLQIADGSCVGFLEKANTFKHFVYPTRDSRFLPNMLSSVSLKLLLKNWSIPTKPWNWADRLQLARVLALAILRLHSTPWLPVSWNSNNISFFPLDSGPKHKVVLENPFIDVPLVQGPWEND